MKTHPFLSLSLIAILAILFSGNVSAESLTVNGKITDATSGSPIVGVSILLKGSAISTISDWEGKYSITAKEGDSLLFSYSGYAPKTVKVTSGTLNVVLKPDRNMLSELAVDAYYVAPKKHSFSGSVSRAMAISYGLRNTEEYKPFAENRFLNVSDEPLSTFSIDVDAASYGNMRRFINQGQLPPTDAIRTEELINYFSYDYDEPNRKDPVKLSAKVGNCPWNKAHRLIKIGVKAQGIPGENLSASNLVFLIDVSGSMYGPTRLELVKSSLKLLINNLREKDRVSIVVYAGNAGEVLPSTPGSDKQKIRDALDQLTAGGSTAGGAGIQLAYKIARNNFIQGGNNRVILCTDGDFSVGVSSGSGLEDLITKERKSGVFLTVLGYGMGNYKDNLMQVLAEKGNGNHAYIDNLQEANKVLVQEFGSTLHTIAKDVKLQIEFNPEQVQAYRLIGYESRLLEKEDFNDDTKDAGEMGAGHRVAAFYEIVPVGVESVVGGSVDPLKYQKPQTTVHPNNYTGSKELLTIKLRYKDPDKDSSKKIELPVIDNKGNNVSADFRFASAVAMFGQLLSDSDFKGEATYDKVIALAKTGLDNDEQGYRREFIRLVEAAKGIKSGN